MTADERAEQLATLAVGVVEHDRREPTGLGPVAIIAQNIAAAIRAAEAEAEERTWQRMKEAARVAITELWETPIPGFTSGLTAALPEEPCIVSR